MDSICLKIKVLRNKFNLTQDEFASSIGVKRSKIAQIESKQFKPTINVIKSIVLKYNIPYDYFFKEVPNADPNYKFYDRDIHEWLDKLLKGEQTQKLKSYLGECPNCPNCKDKAEIISLQKDKIKTLEQQLEECKKIHPLGKPVKVKY